MTVKAIRQTAVGRNGVGAFILQCKSLSFHYCDWSGSSGGMNAFLSSNLSAFASDPLNKAIEIHVSPRPNHHPVVKASYINGREKAICVRNLDALQVLRKVELLRDASGEKTRRVKGGRVVGSLNPSVRGIWSPFHGAARETGGFQYESKSR